MGLFDRKRKDDTWPELSDLDPSMQEVVDSGEWGARIEGWAMFLYSGEDLEDVYKAWIVRLVRCERCNTVVTGRLAWQPGSMSARCPACEVTWASPYRALRIQSWPVSMTMNEMDEIVAMAAQDGRTWDMLLDDLLWEANGSIDAVAGLPTVVPRLLTRDWPAPWTGSIPANANITTVAGPLAANLGDIRAITEAGDRKWAEDALETRIKQVGQWAFDTNGTTLMTMLAREVERLGGRTRDCEFYWNTLGGWQY